MATDWSLSMVIHLGIVLAFSTAKRVTNSRTGLGIFITCDVKRYYRHDCSRRWVCHFVPHKINIPLPKVLSITMTSSYHKSFHSPSLLC